MHACQPAEFGGTGGCSPRWDCGTRALTCRTCGWLLTCARHHWREQNHRQGSGNCSDDADAATVDAVAEASIAHVQRSKQAGLGAFEGHSCAREYLLPNAYVLQLAAVLRSFPAGNVMVVFHEDMLQDPRAAVTAVRAFLGAADAPPLQGLEAAAGRMRFRPPGKHALAEATKRKLCDLFMPFNKHLAKLLGVRQLPFRTCGSDGWAGGGGSGGAGASHGVAAAASQHGPRRSHLTFGRELDRLTDEFTARYKMPFPADTACLRERGIRFGANLPRPFDTATTPDVSFVRKWTGEGDAFMNHICRGTGTRAKKGAVDLVAAQKLERLVTDLARRTKAASGVAPAMGKNVAFLFAWNKYHIRTPTVQRMYDRLNVSYHVIATHECGNWSWRCKIETALVKLTHLARQPDAPEYAT